MEKEEVPVSDKIEVKDSRTIYRSNDWWKFVSRQKSFGREEVAVYLFKKTDQGWKRKQKLVIRSSDTFQKIANAVRELTRKYPLA